MEGLKRKILIVFLIAIALVLGYQAYAMAEATTDKDVIYVKPAGVKVPFQDEKTNVWIYCREHHNGWGFGTGAGNIEVKYKCVDEFNTMADKDKPAYGFAYLLNKGTESEIQKWLWVHSGQSDGAYILNAKTNFYDYFTGYDGNTNVDPNTGIVTGEIQDSNEENHYNNQTTNASLENIFESILNVDNLETVFSDDIDIGLTKNITYETIAI